MWWWAKRCWAGQGRDDGKGHGQKRKKEKFKKRRPRLIHTYSQQSIKRQKTTTTARILTSIGWNFPAKCSSMEQCPWSDDRVCVCFVCSVFVIRRCTQFVLPMREQWNNATSPREDMWIQTLHCPLSLLIFVFLALEFQAMLQPLVCVHRSTCLPLFVPWPTCNIYYGLLNDNQKEQSTLVRCQVSSSTITPRSRNTYLFGKNCCHQITDS